MRILIADDHRLIVEGVKIKLAELGAEISFPAVVPQEGHQGFFFQVGRERRRPIAVRGFTALDELADGGVVAAEVRSQLGA